MEMALWLGQGTECNKWLSLNKPSNIWHCSKEICHKTTQRERERKKKKERNKERKKQRKTERKKEKKRKKERNKQKKRERERARARWMPNAMVTAGNRAPQVEFPSSVLPVLWMCTTVFAWRTPSLMDCRVWSQVIAFGGALSLYNVSYTSLTRNSCNTKVVFNNFDRGSHMYIYNYTYI